MTTDTCPRFEALSALVDDALPPAERVDTLAHAEHCPTCTAALAELRALGAEFAALPQERLGYDLGAVIEAQIAAEARRPANPRPGGTTAAPSSLRDRWRRWLAGFALPAASGAAALVLGLYLGAHLAVAPELDEPRVAMMSVFGTMPPGTVCTADGPCLSGYTFE